MLAGTVVILSLVLGASILAADPALAVNVSPVSLSDTAGHTCAEIGSWPEGDGTYGQADFCIELGIYTSAATGQSSVVAQVESICQDPDGFVEVCMEVNGWAAPYTPNIEGTESLASEFFCSDYDSPPEPGCIGGQNNRTYFEPIATTSSSDNSDFLYIYPGSCVNNVWAVLWAGSGIQMPDADYHSASLLSNLGTPHFDVCMSSSGSVSWDQIT